jgi:cytochrome c-type biogenesis protein
MSEYFIAAGFVFWLGILTSISPCPLATNITALSFLLKRIEKTSYVFVDGLFYIFGRVLLYSVLGFIILKMSSSSGAISFFLQNYINKILGPLLILAGFFMLGLFKMDFLSFMPVVKTETLAKKKGSWGAFLMGIVFALAFCPISAALYFGSMLPLAFKNNSAVLYPFLYGLGSGLPVVIAGIVLAFGLRKISTITSQIATFEKKVKLVTSIIFILAGIYLSLKYIVGIALF